MIDLYKLSIEQLQDLQEQILIEIASRNGFDAEFALSNKAVFKGPSFRQIEYAESLAKKTNSIIKPTKSQITKYMDIEEMGKAIDLMKEGKRIRIL
jgi:hypothetical protein